MALLLKRRVRRVDQPAPSTASASKDERPGPRQRYQREEKEIGTPYLASPPSLPPQKSLIRRPHGENAADGSLSILHKEPMRADLKGAVGTNDHAPIFQDEVLVGAIHEPEPENETAKDSRYYPNPPAAVLVDGADRVIPIWHVQT